MRATRWGCRVGTALVRLTLIWASLPLALNEVELEPFGLALTGGGIRVRRYGR